MNTINKILYITPYTPYASTNKPVLDKNITDILYVSEGNSPTSIPRICYHTVFKNTYDHFYCNQANCYAHLEIGEICVRTANRWMCNKCAIKLGFLTPQ